MHSPTRIFEFKLASFGLFLIREIQLFWIATIAWLGTKAKQQALRKIANTLMLLAGKRTRDYFSNGMEQQLFEAVLWTTIVAV